MENLTNNNLDDYGDGSEPKSTRGKFFAVLIALILLGIGGLIALQRYEIWRGQKEVEELANNLKKYEEDTYKQQLADTYGGKTPQETLSMYIDAVEEGDYELASKYFVIGKKETDFESSKKMSDPEIVRYILLLKKALDDFDVEGKYSADKKYFSLYKPILIQMSLYPNGIWKIEEI